MPAIHRKPLVWLILTFSTSPSKTTIQIAIAGPLERHTDCIGLGWLMQHTPPRATQLTHTLQFMHVSDNLQVRQIKRDTFPDRCGAPGRGLHLHHA
jgi:hypothetical protein